MPKQLNNTKRGFTIIEVVLVLAIAGLIFLMVFTALPALQRTQRDTARRDDLARFLTQITNYQTNNRGKIPGTGATNAADAVTKYANFMISYLWASGDEFVDPDGEPYVIGGICTKYGDDTSKVGGQNCSAGGIVASEEATTIAKKTLPETNPLVSNVAAADESTCSNPWDGTKPPCADALKDTSASTTEFSHAIFLYQNAKCDGESVTAGTGARNLAIQYKLEGGGVYCGAV